MSVETEAAIPWGEYRDIPWSRFVLLARNRHKRDLVRSLTDESYPFYYDEAAATRAVNFISLLRHFDGEWIDQQFTLSDWQEWDIIRVIFGWKRKSDGSRRFRTAYIEIPRRNGKSALAAAICAYMLIADGEYGAQVYSAATVESQARIVWETALKMIQRSPELRNEVTAFADSIVNHHLGSRFMPLGRDSKAHDGFSVHLGCIDEYHAHRTSQMWDVISSGRGSRRQPLLLAITTAGFGVSGPCAKESALAKKILEGVIENDSYFAFIATVDNVEDWRNPIEWQKANPNFGITVYEEGFLEEFREADLSPEKQNGFKTKKLNIWTEQVTRWISIEQYKKCCGPIDRARLKGKRCFAGLDLGISKDLSALALAFYDPDPIWKDRHGEIPIYLLMKYWVPEESIYERLRTDGVDYPSWVRQGWMTTTPGKTTRYDYIRRDLAVLRDEFDIAEIAMDRSHGHELMTHLQDDGMTVVKHAQNMSSMNFPTRTVEELILQERLKPGNDPVLLWMFSHAQIRRDGYENIKVEKDKHEPGNRVDGIIAAVMGIGRLVISPEPVAPVYESQGLVIL